MSTKLTKRASDNEVCMGVIRIGELDDMIGTIDIAVNAAHPNVPLAPVFAWWGAN